MKAQKVQFIFVEKDPWYKKIVSGLSGRSAGSGKYGCNTHGFRTDSSKYRFSNSFMKETKKIGRGSRPLSSDGVAFSADEAPYPERRTKTADTQRSEHMEHTPKNERKRPLAERLSKVAGLTDARKETQPMQPMHEDRRISAAEAPQDIFSTPDAFRSSDAQPGRIHRRQAGQETLRKPSENEIADKLSRAFDDYDASEQSFGMSAALFQEDIREKAQQLKEKSADKFSAAKDRITEVSMQEDTFASKVRKAYERTSERASESRHALFVWGAGGAAGFAVCFIISLIIVNANF
ncbi:MAG: hypothetical protein LBL36_03755 [Clostridiales Family XIII bacterium]|jgi:hypothetical protein|nr:hypothetical protein [Clostridiales Family XIII bacterium]